MSGLEQKKVNNNASVTDNNELSIISKKINKVTAIIIIFTISICFISTILWNGIDALITSFKDTKEITINHSKLYTPKPLSAIESFNENLIFKDFGKSVSSFTKRLQNSYFKFNGVKNDIYKDKTDRLTYVCPYENTKPLADNVLEFNKYLQTKKIDFFYAQAPFKILRDEKNLFYNIVDYSNKNADEFIAELKLNGTNTLDLRNVLVETNRNIAPLFFYTDSRWSINTSFRAYTNIMEHLISKFKIDRTQYSAFSDYSNFIVNVSDKVFIGNQAKSVGQNYTDKKDIFEYFAPYARTDFELKMIKNDGNIITKKGDYNTTHVNLPASKNNLFSYYLGDPSPQITLQNNMCSNNDKILILGDDFINPIASFLSLNFKDTHIINLSLYKESIIDYIEKNNFDYVLMLYNPKSFQNEDFFNLT